MLLLEAAEATRNQRKAQAKSNVMQERAAKHQAQQKAVLERSAARDNEILARQREERRRRVYEDRVRLRQQFEEEWKIKLDETVQADVEAAKDWVESGSEAATSRIQKELQILKRKFYAAPTPETAEQERALSNPANEIFARIAHHLYENGATLRGLFQQYDEEVCSRMVSNARETRRRWKPVSTHGGFQHLIHLTVVVSNILSRFDRLLIKC